MSYDVHNNRLTVYQKFTRVVEIQVFSDEALTIPLPIPGGKAWFSIGTYNTDGSFTRLIQYHSSDPPTANVEITDGANGKFEITIPQSDLLALDTPVDLVWDAAVQTVAGIRHVAIPPSVCSLLFTLNDPALVP